MNKWLKLNKNLCKQISLDVIKDLEREPDAFVLFYIFPLLFLLSKLCNSIAFAVLLDRCNSWNERLFIWYVQEMWLNGTLKMRIFANENKDIGKISPTFFPQIIFMWKLRMSCSSCRKTERSIKSCKAIRIHCVLRGCQPPPPSSNIENWQGRDNRWHHNARNMTSSVQKKHTNKMSFVLDWFTFHQSHYCLYYNGIPRFLRKRSMLNVK